MAFVNQTIRIARPHLYGSEGILEEIYKKPIDTNSWVFGKLQQAALIKS